MAQSKIELRPLGPLSLAIDEHELRQLPRKADALLALQPARLITRETFADFLSADRGPEQARHALIENGFVHIPETAPWLDAYLHEMTVFPNGKHDDQVDSKAQFLDCPPRCRKGATIL